MTSEQMSPHDSVSVRSSLKSLYMAMPFKQQIFTILRTVWVPPPNIYRYLYFRGKFKVDVGERYFLINHYGFEVETSIFWCGLTGGWEKVSLATWLDLCKRATVILDVGANTGIYSLVAKSVNPQARVYGFDPIERVCEKLRANNALNGYDIKCMQVALSNYDGDGIIYDLPTDHIYSVTVNKNLHTSKLPVIETAIRTKKLSTFIEEEHISKVDLIKLDVETHEPEVLAGMGEYLGSMRPTLLLEVWNDEVGKQIENVLSKHKYFYFSTDEIKPLTREEHIRNPQSEKGYLSYLVCSEQVARDLQIC